MTTESGAIEWFQPRRRALFAIEGIRVARSLRRVLRQGHYEIKFDTSFEEVMRSCMRPSDNWISEDLIRVYTQAHLEGWAHSVECWQEGTLVGGLYGLALGGCFCAESMFHRKANFSKVALWAAVEECRRQGFLLFDAQVINPHLRSLGAFEVSHEHYMSLLARAMSVVTPWSAHGEPETPYS